MKVPRFISRLFLSALVLALLASLVSCHAASNTAVLWTDRPELAFYAQYFNAGQDRFKVEVRYFSSPAQRLAESGEHPDIVVASWLRSAETKALFRPLDSLFTRDGLDPAAFYPSLLELGVSGRRQYLLPVNFNIPAIVFPGEFSEGHSNPFIIEMEEMKERARDFNVVANRAFSRVGFSPLSNAEFLLIVANFFGAAFREASPIAWDIQAMEHAVTWIQHWIVEANTSIQMEDDFVSKFYFEPPERLVNTGRVLYIHMNSSRFFTLPEEHRRNLDFRWIAANESIPLDESVYFGIHRRSRARAASEAFARWFFTAETQRMLLEEKRRKRLNETSFGIAGGFSAMRTVTEQVFPQFYPGLLGRMPPDNFLTPANILPSNWLAIKERVVLPYLQDRARHTQHEVRPLDRRIVDWYRLNRG
ncbi:MAG: hypothetical protein FWB99_11860 [Treponema sp.]|nr:hypothetical protein [Treponema sp.]